MAQKKILLLGSSGLIGNAILKKLSRDSSWEVIAPTSQDLDLKDSAKVQSYFAICKPDYVVNAAGKSGGVSANIKFPGDYALENTLINTNVLNAAFKNGAKRLIQFIPACIYPLNAPLPYKENSLFSGPMEESSKYFAAAKLNALMMAQALNIQHQTQFISIIPSNVYGPSIKTASDSSHVIPSLLQKMKMAKEKGLSSVEVWGNGKNQRDFLHGDDLAKATLDILTHANPPDVINVGSGTVTTVEDLATLIRSVVGYNGTLDYKDNGLGGANHKYLDCSTITNLGWSSEIRLEAGLKLLLA